MRQRQRELKRIRNNNRFAWNKVKYHWYDKNGFTYRPHVHQRYRLLLNKAHWCTKISQYSARADKRANINCAVSLLPGLRLGFSFTYRMTSDNACNLIYLVNNKHPDNSYWRYQLTGKFSARVVVITLLTAAVPCSKCRFSLLADKYSF